MSINEIHVAGLIRLSYPGKTPNLLKAIKHHFEVNRPKGSSGILSIMVDQWGSTANRWHTNVTIAGDLQGDEAKIAPMIEAWLKTRISTLPEDVNIIQAIVQAVSETPSRIYLWNRTHKPGIKAVAMELDT